MDGFDLVISNDHYLILKEILLNNDKPYTTHFQKVFDKSIIWAMLKIRILCDLEYVNKEKYGRTAVLKLTDKGLITLVEHAKSMLKIADSNYKEISNFVSSHELDKKYSINLEI